MDHTKWLNSCQHFIIHEYVFLVAPLYLPCRLVLINAPSLFICSGFIFHAQVSDHLLDEMVFLMFWYFPTTVSHVEQQRLNGDRFVCRVIILSYTVLVRFPLGLAYFPI